jgi:flavorubredoxin
MRKIADGVWLCGVIDWDRRLFDALIPLPEGTSYNAYLVQGRAKTALLDTVEPTKTNVLIGQLKDVPSIDFVVSHHAEQDHSGAIPAILAKYPQARVLATAAGRNTLIDLLHLQPDRVTAVRDGETLALGGKTLRFISVPWVHWPDTMATYLEENRILFTCDFFGSHLAASDLYSDDGGRVYAAAKRYYAEIMMPFAKHAAKNVEKVAPLPLDVIAPSHGPLYKNPSFIMEAWREWTSAEPKNLAVMPYVSMHDSTRSMADRLTDTLIERGVNVERFDLTATDLGLLAMALVDARTLLLGSPAVLRGLHPLAIQAASLVNALKPKLKLASAFGSYGWEPKALENVPALLSGLEIEFIPPVFCKGAPREADFQALDGLAQAVAARHPG